MRQPAVGKDGAVVSADPLATEAGLAVLCAGGNAVDSAVAVALVLAVVYPEAGNLGGGGFAVLKMNGELAALDFRETAPAGSRRDMFLDQSGRVIPGASLVGPLASGVPGSPSGLFALHERFGHLPWATIVAPAYSFAAEGFPVSGQLHDRLNRSDIRSLIAGFHESSRVWLPYGEPPAIGSTLRLPALAATLERYADEGPRAITEGSVAAAVEAASKRHGGAISAADLAAYLPVWRSPLLLEAFGWSMATMPLPSSGGVILGQALAMLERLNWGDLPRRGAERTHLLAEVLRRAYADRMLLGDPETTHATEAQLLSTDWVAQRRSTIDWRKATPSAEVEPWPGANAAGNRESSDTTHLSVIDPVGNLVSLTYTLNGLFGCGLWVEGAGFFLNNEMDGFAVSPGEPNAYGLLQGEPNSVAPGKRMLSSMTPILACRGEEAYALGGRGGSRIPSSVLQVLLNLLVDGEGLRVAIGRQRCHHQWIPDRLEIEEGALSLETLSDLERRGHTLVPSFAITEVHVAHRLLSGGVEAAADPRGSGSGGIQNVS